MLLLTTNLKEVNRLAYTKPIFVWKYSVHNILQESLCQWPWADLFFIVEQSATCFRKKFRDSPEACSAPLHCVVIMLCLVFSCSCVSFMALTKNHLITSKANGDLQGLFIYLEMQTKALGFRLQRACLPCRGDRVSRKPWAYLLMQIQTP